MGLKSKELRFKDLDGQCTYLQLTSTGFRDFLDGYLNSQIARNKGQTVRQTSEPSLLHQLVSRLPRSPDFNE